MALIRTIESEPPGPVVLRAADWREVQVEAIGDYDTLASRAWNEIRAIDIFPGCRLDAPVLEAPATWVPRGSLERAGSRGVTPAKAGVPEDARAAELRDESVRRALLALWLPQAPSGTVRQPKVSTWIRRAGELLRIARWQFDNLPSVDGSVFSRITMQDLLVGFFPTLDANEDTREGYARVLNILVDAGERGRISDWPRLFGRGRNIPGEQPLEAARRNLPAIVPASKAVVDPITPYGDAFVGEMIHRALWLHENLADQYLECWKNDRLVRNRLADEGISSKDDKVRKERLKTIQDVDWRDARGQVLDKLPFSLRYLIKGKEILSDAWPPPGPRAFSAMLNTLQGCNLSVVGLCTGARASEILSADEAPFGESDGRYHARTFKLVDDLNGTMRDWPLHPAAVRALEVQRKIAGLVRPDGVSRLWVVLKADQFTRLTDPNQTLRRTVRHLALDHLLGSGTAHQHRWRHTVARLVALSVVGAPQVLFDLFGHRDLDMTLHYMLSDPAIAEEAMKVAKESTYAMVQDSLVELSRDEVSGPAAGKLREALPRAMRRGEERMDTDSLLEAAKILTWEGRYWSLVRPGVICTKGLSEYGPCTRDRGAPDAGTCRTSCEHRLEQASAKKQSADTLSALIGERARAVRDGADMLVVNFEGQIMAELKRWDEVRGQVLAEHPDIKRLWEESQR